MNGLLHKSYCRLAGFISLAKHSISLNEAKAIRDNVAFFQTIRAALVNSSGAGKTAKERDFAVQQIIDQPVVSTEIVDILAATGMQTPDISILSDEFLAEKKVRAPESGIGGALKLLRARYAPVRRAMLSKAANIRNGSTKPSPAIKQGCYKFPHDSPH